MRRKLICAILCVSLLLLLIPGITVSAADKSIVRVKLSTGETTSVSFYLDGNYSIYGNDAIGLERQLYTARLESGAINLYIGSTLICGGSSVKLIQHSPTPGRNNFIWMYRPDYGYTQYPGDMEFIVYTDSDTKVTSVGAINHVYIEDYVYGVVPNEVSDLWPIEALKSQAVAARTYVENRMGRSGAFDVFDTASNQVYCGYNPSAVNSIKAVDDTAKTVLKYGDKLVDVYFSASNGGYTDIPQHVWTATNPVLPYHIIQADPYDVQNPDSLQEVLIFPKVIADSNKIAYLKSSKGTMVPGNGSEAPKAEEYLKAAALPAVAAQGYIAGGTGDIQIIGINNIAAHTHDTTRSQKHGGVPGVSSGNDYNGTNGCIDFVNANINMTVLAKRYVTSTGAPIVMLGDCNGDGKINIYDYTFIRLDILGLKPLTGNARIAADVNQDGKINIYDYTFIRLDILGIKKIMQPDPSLGILVQEPIAVDFTIDMHAFDTGGPYAAFRNGDSTLRLFVVEQTDTSWNIYHRRYGHGIGFSQRGAQQRANAGIGYVEILSFYFPNTTLAQLVYDRPALTPISPPDSTNATVIDPEPPLNVRSSPDDSSKANIIGTLPYGARIKITDTTSYSGWYVVDYGGTGAFVAASKVK